MRSLARQIDELQEENAQLREAVKARDAFLAVAAHELRNPMTPIVGRVQRLRRLLGESGTHRGILEESVGQIELLIANYLKRATTLLDVSRISTGNFRPDLARANISDIAREVGRTFAPMAKRAGCRLEVEVPPADSIRVCDRLAIEQILDNLLSNAIKYGAGQPILLSVAEDPAGAIILRVCDGGPGICPDSRVRVFERFERAVQAGEHGGGFGVGLWVVGQLTKAMAGEVTISTPAIGGSIFTVTLPLGIDKVRG